jgi:DnaJ-class molecular chaperone
MMTQLRHKSEAVPHPRSKQRGDLFTEVKVKIPKNSDLSGKQQELLLQFQELEDQKR